MTNRDTPNPSRRDSTEAQDIADAAATEVTGRIEPDLTMRLAAALRRLSDSKSRYHDQPGRYEEINQIMAVTIDEAKAAVLNTAARKAIHDAAAAAANEALAAAEAIAATKEGMQAKAALRC